MTTLPKDEILTALSEAGICRSPGQARLEYAGTNPNRTDLQRRRIFRVVDQDRAVCALVVGKDLEPLWGRALEFSAACPQLACKPMTRGTVGTSGFIAFDYFDGQNLEALAIRGRLTPADALAHALTAWNALRETREPSNHAAARNELESFFSAALSAGSDLGIDQVFLKELVFPLVAQTLLQPAFATRWTNGDFIPSNILVNRAGQVRLVDYEFAGKTHFAFDDAWRWRTFNPLPGEIQAIGGEEETILKEPGAESYCLLRQLVLTHQSTGSLLAVCNLQTVLARLQDLVSPTRGHAATPSASNRIRHEPESRQPGKTDKNLAKKTIRHLQSVLHRALGAPPPKFHLHFDSPTDWIPSDEKILVRGWCFPKSSLEFNAIRVQVDDRTYRGHYGIARPDVGHAHRKFPQSAHSGFEVEIDLKPEDKTVAVALGDIGNRWHTVLSFNTSKPPDTGKGSYAHWIKACDTLTPETLASRRTAVAALPLQPVISVLLPVYNTPETLLTRTIASVQNQIYPHWELCIADDASGATHVRPFLEQLAKSDPRIKVVFRESNGHISAASNSALALATGEFVALLDHDDELRPHALAEVVCAVNRQPGLVMAYSDEDKIDCNGQRHAPYFKPDWMPDLLTGHNYLCHLFVCRTATVRTLGGWRSALDGAQDWDLQLRITEQAAPHQIVHIPKILYHWRVIAGSTALATGEKGYAVAAAQQAISEHLKRTNTRADLIHLPGNHWRVRHRLPDPAPPVSLIIPTRDGVQFLRRCINSILEKTVYPNYEIIIVDNDSADPATITYLESLTRSTGTADTRVTLRVERIAGAFNYSALNNAAVHLAKGEFVGLLNNDLEVITDDWLEELVSQAARPGVGCVGPLLLYPDGRIQHAGVVLGIAGHAGHAFKGFTLSHPGYMNHARLVKNYTAVTGACLLVRKSTYERVGGLDETNLAVALNDVDFCLKVRAAGFRNLWTPFAELYHHESATRGHEDTPEKKERFAREREVLRKRWLPSLLNDPAYNPNLTTETEDFALAYPPRHDT